MKYENKGLNSESSREIAKFNFPTLVILSLFLFLLITIFPFESSFFDLLLSKNLENFGTTSYMNYENKGSKFEECLKEIAKCNFPV